MRSICMGFVGFSLLMGVVAVGYGDPDTSLPPLEQANDILQRGYNATTLPQAEAALAEMEALIVQYPGSVDLSYGRAEILALMGRMDDALAEYERALTLEPSYLPAVMAMGLLHADAGRLEEGLTWLERVISLDPTHVNALYNAGMMAYLLGRYETALSHWQQARTLVPDDFGLARKVLQAQYALGQWEVAAATHEEVIAMWRSSTDPAVRGQSAFVVDQLDVGPEHVFVYENLDPSGDFYDLYSFQCVRDDNTVRYVNLESSAYGRDVGTPYLFAIETGAYHSTTGPAFSSLPPYSDLRASAVTLIEQAQAGQFDPPPSP